MLQHALRIGVRKQSCAPLCVIRALNTPAPQDVLDQNCVLEDQDATGIRDAYDTLESKGKADRFASSRDYAGTPLEPFKTGPVSTSLSQAELPRSSREQAAIGKLTGACKPRQSSHHIRNGVQLPASCSIFVDVDTLAVHEIVASNGEKETDHVWISDSELRGVMRTAMTRPFKRTGNSLLHPVSPQELELRLHQAMTFTPLPSLARLISYHDAYPSLYSAASYNFLVQLAIRHTSYTKAIRLLRRMEESGIKPDECSKILYVRLLVRIGRWDRAWLFVRQQLSSGDEHAHLSLLLELLGYCKPTDFQDRSPNPDTLEGKETCVLLEKLSDGVHKQSFLQDWQKSILAVVPDHLPSIGYPPAHFIQTVVRYLLRNSRMETARAATLEWISNLPKQLSLARKRHCLHLLHLHLASSDKTLVAHLAHREFVKLFLELRPDLRPNSSTLFLLLRSLTRAKGKTTYHTLRLVYAFSKKWGSEVIDRRVRRRVVSIALREGRLNVARAWLETEERSSLPRKLMALQHEVVGEQAIKPPQRIRRQTFQKLMPGIHSENRKWRWVKRRLWRLEQTLLSKRSQAQAPATEREKEVIIGSRSSC